MLNRALPGAMVMSLCAFACDSNPSVIDAAIDAPADAAAPSPWVSEWNEGDPGLNSISQVAFTADGTLIVADATLGRIAIIDPDGTAVDARERNHFDVIANLGQRIADAVGNEQVGLVDLDVDPLSHQVYLTVGSATETTLVRMNGAGELFVVALDNVRYAAIDFEADAAGSSVLDIRASHDQLVAAIGSRTFTNGRLLIARFPVGSTEHDVAWTRTYHRSHGQWETSDSFAPIDHLVVFDDAAEPFIAASYACAPIVRLDLASIETDDQVVGETPLDVGAGRILTGMFPYERDGGEYLLVSYRQGARSPGGDTFHGLRIERALIEQDDSLDERAPIVVARDGSSADPRVQVRPEMENVLAIAPRDENHFIAVFGDGRISTLDLP